MNLLIAKEHLTVDGAKITDNITKHVSSSDPLKLTLTFCWHKL